MAIRAALRRHEDGQGSYEWIEGVPAPRLGTWITGYTGYREVTARPVRRLETPSGGAVLVISFGDPLAISSPPVGAEVCVLTADTFTSFVGGISDRPAITTHGGSQHWIQVRADPLAIYALFGVPLDEVGRCAGGVVGLADLCAGDWGDRLAGAAGWSARFAMLDDLLAERLARQGLDPAPEIAYAWRRLRASNGRVRIADLVAESGMSHRSFIARFRRQVGVGPRVAARILRYERAMALLAQRPRSIAEVAAASGYSDQAHLDREFAALVGRTPTRLLQQRDHTGHHSVRSISFKTERP